MSTILPEGDAARKAVRWISERLQETPREPVGELVNEACARFDLNPKEAEQLAHFYRQAQP